MGITNFGFTSSTTRLSSSKVITGLPPHDYKMSTPSKQFVHREIISHTSHMTYVKPINYKTIHRILIRIMVSMIQILHASIALKVIPWDAIDPASKATECINYLSSIFFWYSMIVIMEAIITT